MSKQCSVDNLITLSSSPGQTKSSNGNRPRLYMLFRLGLFLTDFVCLFGSFWIAGLIVGMPITPGPGWVAHFWPLLFSVLALSFFSTQGLYSYHLIFSMKKQLYALHIALIWGVIAALILSAYYTFPAHWASKSILALIMLSIGVAGLAWSIQLHWQALHHFLRAFGISLIAIWVIHFFFKGQVNFLPHHIWIGPVGLIFSSGTLSIGRYFLLRKIYNDFFFRSFRRQVAVLGTNEDSEKIVSHIIENNAPFWVSGTIGCDNSRLNTPVSKDCLGDIIELPMIFCEHDINDVIVTDESIDKRTLISLLDYSIQNGITVWFPPKLLPIIDKKIHIDHFCGIPMIRMGQQKPIISYERIEYFLDAVMTLPLVIALLPVLAVVAAAIKIDSMGPIFYRASAIGKNGQPFKMFKFRSMRVNNDSQIHKQFVTKLIKGDIDNENSDGKPLKIVDDPRVTSVGKLIRKYSIDELPQLFNVLMGQMRLIGPRPCLPYEFDVYQDWYKKRAAIRPGITGLWQVTGRSEVTFEEMILLDLFYVYNRNLWMDIKILIETIFVVLNKKGAY